MEVSEGQLGELGPAAGGLRAGLSAGGGGGAAVYMGRQS